MPLPNKLGALELVPHLSDPSLNDYQQMLSLLQQLASYPEELQQLRNAYSRAITQHGHAEIDLRTSETARAWSSALAQGWCEELSHRVPLLKELFDTAGLAPRGLALINQALASNICTRDPLWVTKLRAHAAWLAFRCGQHQTSITHAQQALALLPQSEGRSIDTAPNALGAAHDMLGQFAHARRTFEQRAARADSDQAKAFARRNLAVNAMNQGNYSQAEADLAAAQAYVDEHGSPKQQVQYRYLQTRLYLEQGRYDEARWCVQDALQQAKAHQLERWMPRLRIYEARLALANEHWEQLEQQPEAILREPRYVRVYGSAYLLGLELACHRGDLANLQHYALKSLADAYPHNNTSVLWQSLVTIGTSLHQLASQAHAAGQEAKPGPSSQARLLFAESLLHYCAQPEHRTQMYFTTRQQLNALHLPAGLASPWQQLGLAEVVDKLRQQLGGQP